LVGKEGYPMDDVAREGKAGRGVGAKFDNGKALVLS